MNVQFQPNFRTAERRLPFECVALVLQGGGALGAYQAGVYEALAEADINPDWVAGVSIGAINSAIIAGNETSERVGKLRTFWQEITANPLLDWAAAAHTFAPKGYLPRALFNQLSASCAIAARVPRTFSRFGSLLPGFTRTAPWRPRAFTKPNS
jgi:NTE family protein